MQRHPYVLEEHVVGDLLEVGRHKLDHLILVVRINAARHERIALDDAVPGQTDQRVVDLGVTHVRRDGHVQHLEGKVLAQYGSRLDHDLIGRVHAIDTGLDHTCIQKVVVVL